MIYNAIVNYYGQKVKMFEHSQGFLNVLNKALNPKEISVKSRETKVLGLTYLYLTANDNRLMSRASDTKVEVWVKKLHNLFAKKVAQITEVDNEKLLACFNEAVEEANFLKKYYKEIKDSIKEKLSNEEFTTRFTNLTPEAFDIQQGIEFEKEEHKSPISPSEIAQKVLEFKENPYEYYGEYLGVDFLLRFDDLNTEEFKDEKIFSDEWFNDIFINSIGSLKDKIDNSSVRRFFRFENTQINEELFANQIYLGLLKKEEYNRLIIQNLEIQDPTSGVGLIVKVSLANLFSDLNDFLLEWLTFITFKKQNYDEVFNEGNMDHIFNAFDICVTQVLIKINRILKDYEIQTLDLTIDDEKTQNIYFSLIDHKDEFLEFVDIIFEKLKYQKSNHKHN